MSKRSAGLRRYPALSYLVAAGALALLLPSALTLPRSGPQTLAEYAPVPGDSDQAGNVAELGSTTSKGTGFSKGDPSKVDDAPPLSGKQKFVLKQGTKRCVGNPPRQTEDPLSPPCIAFFDGDNGGATDKGVTREEVRVVVELERTSTDQRKGVTVDCALPIDDEDDQSDINCKAFMRYFNSRFQTWGRTVHLWNHHALNPDELNAKYDPFASGANGSSSSFSKHKILSFGYLGQDNNAYKNNAPYFISYRPDTEDQAAIAASYVCSELAGKPASFSGSPLDRDTERVWGYWGDETSFKKRLLERLDEGCGIKIPPERQAAGVDPRSGNAARLRAQGVTSVLIRVGNTSHAVITNEATQTGWFPEWVLPGESNLRGLDGNFYGRLANQSQWQNMFGITFDYRRDAIDEQSWFRAYREGCPDCPVPTAAGGSNTPTAYDTLMLLFQGIQAAGPKLTAENIDRGLHSLPKNGSPTPYKPAAYFDPGNWTFIKDAMRIWWDPSGVPPGSGNTGCYRLPQDGKRYRAGEWLPNSSQVKAAGPCQADAF